MHRDRGEFFAEWRKGTAVVCVGLLLAVFGLASARAAEAPAPKQGEAVRKALAQLQGRWSFAVVYSDGERQEIDPADEYFLRYCWRIEGDKWFAGNGSQMGVIRLDPGTSPMVIDLVGPQGTVEGIIEVGKDTLRWYYNRTPGAKERPTRFPPGNPEPGMSLYVLRRVKQ